MTPDDEILFGHVQDECPTSYERVAALARQANTGSAPSDLALALAVFELHGATLRSFMGWYPDDTRVRAALADWELFGANLGATLTP
ncbi:MAG TPA: hypothetical protein VFE36_13435 [Candidatus Baltobacteraceae bacterium]|jgi:hypothetical protein|nr:hypothetical protein [Candidatus Baltobacteraceae bacterium]